MPSQSTSPLAWALITPLDLSAPKLCELTIAVVNSHSRLEITLMDFWHIADQDSIAS